MKVVRKETIYPNVADSYISKEFDQKKIYKVGVLPVLNEGSPDEKQSIYSAKLLQQVLYAIPNFKVVDVNIVQNELTGLNKSDYLKKSTISKISKSLGLDLVLYSVQKYKFQPALSSEDSRAAYSGGAIGSLGGIAQVGGAAEKSATSKGSEYALTGGVFTFYDVKDLSTIIEITTKNNVVGSLSEAFKTSLLTEFDLLDKNQRNIRRNKTNITLIDLYE
jgi:hypothetical protein